MIGIVRSGLLTTVQDLGRHGYAHLGVTQSGALDRPALIAANRLVGNDPSAAGLETTLTGVTVRAEVATTMAVTGATAAILVNGFDAPFGVPIPLHAGSTVDVAPPRSGVRNYLAFAGGITVAPVLGSRSTDTLSGIGPPPLRAGHVLPIGRPRPTAIRAIDDPIDAHGSGQPAATSEAIVVRIRFGPRDDWFTSTARQTMLTSSYTLTPKTNRVGARLAGPALARAIGGELPSEAIVIGAIQVPGDGLPLVFLADHPTTGGYPVIAVVEESDLPLLAQARPGCAIQFRDAR